MLPDGLVRGGLFAGFSNGGAVRSAAVPFCPSFPAARRCASFSFARLSGQRCRTSTFPFTQTGGQSLPFSTFSGQQACASGRRSRTAHSPCSCAWLLPPHLSFDFRRAGFFGSAPPCSLPPRAVSGPVPVRADASRRSFAFPLARRAPFLPSAPCAPACASRRDGGSCKASCCALLHARPCSCAGGRIALFFRLFPRTPGLCARRAHPGHPCRRAHPGRPCRRAPPFASVRIPPCRRAPFFSISRQESEHKRRILYEHMFV